MRFAHSSLAILIGVALLAGPATAQVSFVDVTASAGVQFQQDSETLIPIGGGVAWADVDNDSDDDLYMTQADGCNRLYRNNGDGTFAEAVGAMGASDCAGTSHGVAIADYDNDGDQDIHVANYGQNRLFQNRLMEDGAVNFVDVTAAALMDNDGAVNSASASWGDYDGDSFLDLAVVNHNLYVPWDEDACQPDLLWHNNGNGTFTNVAPETGIANGGLSGKPGCGLATTWSDYDQDNDVDLMIVNDFGEVNVPNRLFRNDGPDGQGGWKFTDVSRSSLFDYQMFGMGIAIGDFNKDGWFDYYMSDIGPNNLAINVKDGTFSEIGALAGVLATDRQIYGASGLVSWGALFLDVNGDGYEDLVVANGGAPEAIWPGMFGPDYEDFNPNYMYANKRNFSFVEGHSPIGITGEGYHRSVAMSDYDLDGDMDLMFGVLEGNNTLYRNDTVQSFNWLQVKAVGTVSNRDAIGSKIIVNLGGGDRQLREVHGGSSFLSMNSRHAYFSVGDATTIPSVTVRFPSGEIVVVENVAVNQVLEVVETTP